MGDPVPFADDEPVYVDRHNTAHALTTDGQLTSHEQMLCMSIFPIGGTWMRSLGEVILARDERSSSFMLWSQTEDPAFKSWPAWPCQTCVRMAAVSAGAGQRER